MGKYFTIAELSESYTAKSKGIDNTPTPQAQERLNALIDKLLDPLREEWGAPLYINSGYRCPLLNKVVGGASSSQHLRGEAADITAGNREANKKLFQMLRKSGLIFDQLIDEKNYTWLHISLGDRNRREVLHL